MYSAENFIIKDIRLAELEHEPFKAYRKRVNHIGKLAILEKYYWKYFFILFLVSAIIHPLLPLFITSIPVALVVRGYINGKIKSNFQYERRLLRKY